MFFLYKDDSEDAFIKKMKEFNNIFEKHIFIQKKKH